MSVKLDSTGNNTNAGGFEKCVLYDSCLLGCDAAWLLKRFPTFREDTSPSFSSCKVHVTLPL
jgi:hypothetical protein